MIPGQCCDNCLTQTILTLFFEFVVPFDVASHQSESFCYTIQYDQNVWNHLV